MNFYKFLYFGVTPKLSQWCFVRHNHNHTFLEKYVWAQNICKRFGNITTQQVQYISLMVKPK